MKTKILQVSRGDLVVECRWHESGLEYGDCYELVLCSNVHLSHTGAIKRINARKIKCDAKAVFRDWHSR